MYRKIDRYLYGNLTDIYIEKNIGENMKMIYTTKMRKNAGSMITVIPSAITKLLKLEQGDSMRWEVEIEDNTALIKVIPEKKKRSL